MRTASLAFHGTLHLTDQEKKMTRFLVILATGLLSLSAHAQSQGWNKTFVCSGANLQVSITLPDNPSLTATTIGGSLLTNGQGANIPTILMGINTFSLAIMRQDGMSCVLTKSAQGTTGQCGLVAAGDGTPVRCP